MNKLDAEKGLARIELEALHSPYALSITWMGIEVKFLRCAKRGGGNIKKGKAWGKLSYTNYSMDMPINRAQAIEWITLPTNVKDAKRVMLHKKLCAICGVEGKDDERGWGWLRYIEHRMEICPDCTKEIYEESEQPWRDN